MGFIQREINPEGGLPRGALFRGEFYPATDKVYENIDNEVELVKKIDVLHKISVLFTQDLH